MKARVKATGETIDVEKFADGVYVSTYDKDVYHEENLDFWGNTFSNLDYWTRLEHQYAGMAMQGILTNPIGFENIRARGTNIQIETALLASEFAHALVEKMKEER